MMNVQSEDLTIANGTAVIDWLSFTFEGWPDTGDVGQMVQTWLREWIGGPCQGLGGNGLYGFEHSVAFYSVHDHQIVQIAVCAWGGANQKGKIYLSINGTGCSLIKDWPCVRRIMECIKARITRADVAVDAVNGEFTIEDTPGWYEEGGFTSGGRRPNYRVDGDWLTPQGSGRTFYVGNRKNGKYCRVYEKGKQLGNRWSVWNRFEVELHNVDREIPLDIVTNPSVYFAGCYPCCQSLVDVGAERIRTLQEENAISLGRLIGYARIAYGRLIYVMKHIARDDFAQVIDELAVKGVPRRLEKTALHAIFNGPPDGPPIMGASDHG